MSVKVSMSVVKSIIGRHINESINKQHIIDMLTTALDSHTLETLVDICCMEDEHVPFQVGFIVSFNEEGNINHYDHGIMHGTNLRYGVIMQSDDYGTTFNPYYYKMNLHMFDLNDKNEVIMTPIDKYSNEITVVIGEALTDLRNIYESISTS